MVKLIVLDHENEDDQIEDKATEHHKTIHNFCSHPEPLDIPARNAGSFAAFQGRLEVFDCEFPRLLLQEQPTELERNDNTTRYEVVHVPGNLVGPISADKSDRGEGLLDSKAHGEGH